MVCGVYAIGVCEFEGVYVVCECMCVCECECGVYVSVVW